jgi:hypothetical protein
MQVSARVRSWSNFSDGPAGIGRVCRAEKIDLTFVGPEAPLAQVWSLFRGGRLTYRWSTSVSCTTQAAKFCEGLYGTEQKFDKLIE